MAPSENSCQYQDFFTFLGNNFIRGLYNRIVTSCRKYQHMKSKNWLLGKLIEEKTIPSYFKIRNKSHNTDSEAATKTSLEWMKTTLEVNSTEEMILLEELSENYNKLHTLTPDNLKHILKEKIQKKGLGFQEGFKRQKLERFEKLTKPLTSTPPGKKNKDKTSKTRKWVPRSKYRRLTRKLKKQKISVIFNYSKLELTPAMESLLNRGLNFAITPLKLDLTQTLAEFRRFERSLVWKEYFADHEETEYVPPIFKKTKTNMPKNHPVPEPLKTFIHGVRSEICDPENRNKVRPNLPPEERKALAELINLQRARVITIKPCDKGAGLIILDTEEYIRSADKHLSSTQKQDDGTEKPYYEKVDEVVLNEAKAEILEILKEGKEKGFITEDDYNAMEPADKGPATFYQLFKVHKAHEPGRAPPERPVISGSGSITENLSHFVQTKIKELSTKHPSYIQDTPDLLRHIQALVDLPDNVMLVTVDVSALYTNINTTDAIEAVRKALDSREDQTVPTDYIVRLLEMVLKWNIFDFDSQLYKQLIGFAMGTKCAPNVADLFMADIDEKIKALAVSLSPNHISPIEFYKRFLDDIFLLYSGTPQELHQFLDKINEIHPGIKFTMQHTTPAGQEANCDCQTTSSIPFLDVEISVKEGKLKTDLYRKPTDRNQYLLPSSCHPAHCTENIPFSLALRIVRICSEETDRDRRLTELKEMLLARDYHRNVVNSAINKALRIPRSDALKRVVREKSTDRVVFVVTYDPRLPSIPKIVGKHWRTMAQDPRMKEVFNLPPLVAYRRPANIKDKLIRSKMPRAQKRNNRRVKNGMHRCGTANCRCCQFVETGRTARSTATKEMVEINTEVNCQDSNVIYLISCLHCKEQYIGETERKLSKRFAEHQGYVRKKDFSKATGSHFNQRGHDILDMRITILEKLHNKDILYRKERESMWIRKFNTKYKGINRNC